MKKSVFLTAVLFIAILVVSCGEGDSSLPDNSIAAEASASVSADASADTTPEIFPEASKESGTEPSQEESSELSGEASSEASEEVSAEVTTDNSEAASEISEISEISEEASKEVSEDVSEEASQEQISEVSEQETSEEISVEASEEVSDEISEDVSEDISEEVSEDVSKAEAIFLNNGFVVYDGAVYNQSFYNDYWSKEYAKVYKRYAEAFRPFGTKVSVVTPPISSIMITDDYVNSRISSQSELQDKLEQSIIGHVNFVNLKDVYKAHTDEYLYFRSDHHWTHRGAYYAYSEFIKSVGMTPVDIDSLEVKIVGKRFNGSMDYYSGYEPAQYIYDTVEAYMPTKKHTMEIRNTLTANPTVYDSCIVPASGDYLSFLTGDRAYIKINVPENDQDKSILIIKDSYANAFVTYLTEHYGNIYVIDPRHISLNVYQNFKDMGLDDIVFLINTSTAGNGVYCNYYSDILGV